MKIIQSSNTNYRNEIIALYIEAFSTGLSREHIDLEELTQYVDFIFEKGYILLAIENQEFIGTIWVYPLSFEKEFPTNILENLNIANCLYISEMIVAGKFRGQGIGKLLLQSFFDTVDKTKYSDTIIRVWKENIPALRLYEKIGFKPIATIFQTKRIPEKNEFFVMEKIYLHIKLD